MPKRVRSQANRCYPRACSKKPRGAPTSWESAPKCPEFHEYFDWPDAVIEVSPELADIAAVIDEFEAQPRRTGFIRRTKTIRCLLNHDWAIDGITSYQRLSDVAADAVLQHSQAASTHASGGPYP
jgi:hypothetical protein